MDVLFVLGFFPLLLLVVLACWKPFKRNTSIAVLHSTWGNNTVFAIALTAFLWKTFHIASADFSGPRWLLALMFACIALPLFWCNYGFLGVRGFAILQLLWANKLLAIGLGHFSWQWLSAKVYAYTNIFVALYLIVRPYRLRNWLVRRTK
jgi:hypothetical protein